jgi:transcriptional regulator with XRE-family HTH domain
MVILQLNDRIKKIRKALGFSQMVFSKALGISRGHVSSVETGAAEPSEQLINLICATWGVNKEWLANDHGELKIKYKSNITIEEDLDMLLEDADELKYNFLINNLNLLLKTMENFIEFFDNQEIYIAAVDDFILEPGNQRNERVIKKVTEVEKSVEGLKERIKKMKGLKIINGKDKIVPVSAEE